MNLKFHPSLTTLFASGSLSGALLAGPVAPMPMPEADAFSGFDSAIRPITNPTLFDLAVPRTQIHPIFMHHRFPDKINTRLGKVELGGDLNLFALQFEYAFTERLSLVAVKDGYIDFNPDGALFSDEEGLANIGGGLKYAFYLDPASQTAASVTATYEAPVGDAEVFQGKGNGNLNLSLNGLKLLNRWQLAGTAGVQIPFDDDFSTQSFVSTHVSYELSKWFIPLVELNWFHVFDDGDGGKRYSSQAGGAVPAVAESEGADLINWGAANSSDQDYVTLGLGWRTRLTDHVNLGFAYEFSLTDEEDNITDDRFTVDLVWTF